MLKVRAALFNDIFQMRPTSPARRLRLKRDRHLGILESTNGIKCALPVTCSSNFSLGNSFSLTFRYYQPNITLGDDFEASLARRIRASRCANLLF